MATMGRKVGTEGPRSERIQFTTTQNMSKWINDQSKDKESQSQTVHRLITELRQIREGEKSNAQSKKV